MNASDYKLDQKVSVDKKDSWVYNLHEYGLDLIGNHIYLFPRAERATGNEEDPISPGVEYAMAGQFIKNLNACMRVHPEDPIVIHMKTDGGYWEEGMAIYDAIKACPSPVTILNYSTARSMSSIIFSAANKRVMMPHSIFMYHMGTMGMYGTVKSFISFAEFEKKAQKQMIEVYTEVMQRQGLFAGKPKKEIKEFLQSQMDKKEEVYLGAQEAVSYGFADEIFKYDWTTLTQYTDEQLDR